LSFGRNFKFIALDFGDDANALNSTTKSSQEMPDAHILLNLFSGKVFLVCPSTFWLDNPERVLKYSYLANIKRFSLFPYYETSKLILESGQNIR